MIGLKLLIMKNRREFIKKSSLTILATTFSPQLTFGSKKDVKITILHTNDMHSHIEPFKRGRNKGLGGMAKRATIIRKIRSKEKNVLLFDAGDIFQGTPYFNYFGGEIEFKLMSKLKYDAATLGNHDFDNGLEGLKKQLPNANFPFLTANYDFSETILKNKFAPYKIFKRDHIKIGVFGVGIDLKNLVPKKLYGKTKYLDPIKISNKYAKKLKDLNCDLVVCLSHLGYKYNNDKVSDTVLAQKSQNIDIIIGGHTHTFLKKAILIKNIDKKDVLVNQVGFGGINIGKIDIHFKQNNNKKLLAKNSIFVKN